MDTDIIGSDGRISFEKLEKETTVKLYALISKGKAKVHKRFYITLCPA
jgi:hypothetical protein